MSSNGSFFSSNVSFKSKLILNIHPHTHKYQGISSVLFDEIKISDANNFPNNYILKLAIWDTGATGCTITSKIVNELNLIPTGRKIVHTANGVATQNSFLIDLVLPNNIIFRAIEATETQSLGEFDMLIGMNIISTGDFSITNLNGNTCMSFRIPSIHEVDFVSKPNLKY